MRDNILIASLFSTIDLIFLVETWEKNGIGIAKIPGYSHFFITQYGSSNMQVGATTRGHGAIVVLIKKHICS